MLLAALTNILQPVLPETIDHRTWIIEHTGWRLQDEARASQPGDPPQGGVDGYYDILLLLLYYNIIVNPRQSPTCLLYTSPSPRDRTRSRMPSSA